MRLGMISVLSTSLALICLPRPAASQFVPASPQRPQAFFRRLPSPANLLRFPSDAESGGVGPFAGLRNAPQILPWSLSNGANGQEEASAMGVQSPTKTGRCAHILVYKAPTMDAKMIIEAPKAFSSDMPKLEGLQACCEDFRGGVAIPQWGPFLGPQRVGVLHLKPRIQLYPFWPQSSTREGHSSRIP